MNFRGTRIFIWVVFLLFVSPLVQAGIDPKHTPPLSQKEKSSLRYHLENLYNELDLLIKNRRVDLADLRRQEREISLYKVYERIPFERDLDGLHQALKTSAQNSTLDLTALKVTQYSPSGPPPPPTVYTDDRSFRLSQKQLIEQIRFKMTLKGSEKNVREWTQKWSDHVMRIVELDASENKKAITKVNDKVWEIQAKTYRFRNVKFPTLLPKNPRKLLPSWAQKNPDLFSKNEPLLWDFVTRIESLAPNAKPYYENRSKFLLNDARLSFFLSKENNS